MTGVDLGILSRSGSLFVTRPTMMDYYPTPAERRDGANGLWQRIVEDRLKVAIDQRFPLAEAADAHRALESRKTTGSTVLLP